jgi:hypothetical protein
MCSVSVLHRSLKTISEGWTPRSMASALFKKPRVQSSVSKKSVTTSSILASAAGTPPDDPALSSVRVAAQDVVGPGASFLCHHFDCLGKFGLRNHPCRDPKLATHRSGNGFSEHRDA